MQQKKRKGTIIEHSPDAKKQNLESVPVFDEFLNLEDPKIEDFRKFVALKVRMSISKWMIYLFLNKMFANRILKNVSKN